MPRNKKLEDLSMNEKLFVCGLSFTIMQRESKNKSIPRKFRRQLAKNAKHLKDRIDIQDATLEEVKELFSLSLALHQTSYKDLWSIDKLMDLMAPRTSNMKAFYAECKKDAEKIIENAEKQHGMD